MCVSSCSDEDVAKEEHLDNEFLWNLKMLAEVSTKWSGGCPHIMVTCKVQKPVNVLEFHSKVPETSCKIQFQVIQFVI